ncbi:hypothetical protein EXIGLDRAFT_771624 [Exidia glandulosa HHB12029]|uniref:Uncharacterized protein n=1 Tax=Exidia glandulosa HHB12029 TaxID=1314781 RepID=A0A165FUV0_EXIGL|nr:hypothetical protein EXIGLDRAFT_771624 [Exidia glandulosa HHB12029]
MASPCSKRPKTSGVVTQDTGPAYFSWPSRPRIDIDIVYLIATYSSVLTLANLGSCCKAYATVANDERRWRVNRILRAWFGEGGNVRRSMYNYGVLLTGSAVLHVLDPTLFVWPTDLDFAVGYGLPASCFISFLDDLNFKATEERVRTQLHAQLYPERNLVQRVTTFRHKVTNRRVEVITSATRWAMDAVLSHPNSIMHNFVAASTIGCLHPWFTFGADAVTVPLRALPTAPYARELNKYKSRGIRLHKDNGFLDKRCGSACPLLFHRIDDPAVCVVRYSMLSDRELVSGLSYPFAKRASLREVEPGMSYRLGTVCANDFCPHKNESEAKRNKTTENDGEGVEDDVSQSSEHSAHSIALRDKTVEKGKGKAVGAGVKDWGYLANTNERIAKITDFNSAKQDTFYITALINALSWIAVNLPDRDKFYALAVQGSRNAAKVWFVGILVKSYFFDKSGEAPSSVSMNIALLDERETTMANNLLRRYSAPRNSDTSVYTDVRFSKWMSVRHTGESAMRAEHFTEVYDATTGFNLPRTKMRQMSPSNLKKGDLVMVEATVERWHPKKAAGSSKVNYSEYNAFYALNFIALLDDSPPPLTVAMNMATDVEVEVEF